jgi:hypothetical protein
MNDSPCDCKTYKDCRFYKWIRAKCKWILRHLAEGIGFVALLIIIFIIYKSWPNIVKKTPSTEEIIALLLAYIALVQYLASKAQLREAAFEKRYKIYSKVLDIISSIDKKVKELAGDGAQVQCVSDLYDKHVKDFESIISALEKLREKSKFIFEHTIDELIGSLISEVKEIIKSAPDATLEKKYATLKDKARKIYEEVVSIEDVRKKFSPFIKL